MKLTLKQITVSTLAASLLVMAAPFSMAESLVKKPVVKQAAIGAAAGVAVGALSDKATVGRSAATGAVVGAGTGLLTQSKYLKDKPLVRNTLQGAVVGTGVSYATRGNKTKGALVGAGAGAGASILKDYLDKK